jgi:hypothetical protein
LAVIVKKIVKKGARYCAALAAMTGTARLWPRPAHTDYLMADKDREDLSPVYVLIALGYFAAGPKLAS